MNTPVRPEGPATRHPLLATPAGLVSVCQRNARHAYVIPSTKSYVSCSRTNLCFQMKHIKLDIGATQSLWYFPSVDALLKFFENAPSIEDDAVSGHHYTIKQNLSPGDKVITLKCSHIDGYRIELNTDIIPNVIPITVSHLQFHLCREDMEFILLPDNADKIRLPEAVKSSLQYHLTRLGDQDIKRRSWSLLGNDVIDSISIIKLKEVALLCQRQSFPLSSWDHLLNLEQRVLSMDYLLLPSEENEELHEIADEFISSDDIFDISSFV